MQVSLRVNQHTSLAYKYETKVDSIISVGLSSQGFDKLIPQKGH